MRPAPASALACACALASADAEADPFRYVDRDGRAHVVSVRAEQPPDPPAVAAPVELAAIAPAEEFPYRQYAEEAATLYSLPLELIRAVMQVESGFQPHVVSRTGAMGLMQLMPATAGDVGVHDPFDPRENVLGGARQLRVLLNTFDGDVALALAGYHAGAATVQRAGGIPPIVETRKYVAAVIGIYNRLRSSPAAGAHAVANARR